MRQRPTRHRFPTILATIVACVLPIPAAAFQGPRELPELARDAWEATVFVETLSWHRGTGVRDVATGSGVMIAEEPDGTVLIATSAHVVPCETACLIRVHFPATSTRKRSVAVRARRLWHDGRQDLALLRSPKPPGVEVRIARLATETASAGERVLAIGFPDPALRPSERSPRRAKLFSEGLLVEASDGFQADVRAYASTAVDGHLAPQAALIHTAELLPGSSGGPLVDATGAVLGINTGSLVPARGRDCARAETEAGDSCLHLAVALAALSPLAPLSQPPTRPPGRGGESCWFRGLAAY